MDSYEEVHMIKTFRGMLADGAQDTIRLRTNTGATGYKIVKFELIYYDPTGDTAESVLKIYKEFQTSLDDKIDFSDQTLLAANYMEATSDPGYPMNQTIIFDREIFNQDIYISNVAGQSASNGVNYYIELEQVKLDLNENTVATLKDIRNVTAP